MKQDITTMTAKECKIELTKLGVAFKKDATEEVLRDTLTAALDRKGLGIDPANDPVCDSFGSPSPKNPECASCPGEFGKRNEACLLKSESSKAKAPAKVTPEKRQTVKAKYADFKELKESVEKADDARLTMFVDKLLVKGGQSFDELLKSINDRKEALKSDSTDFKNVSIIKKHLKYRASKGWIFTIFKNGKVKATDYSVDGEGAIIDRASEEEGEKAAEAEKAKAA